MRVTTTVYNYPCATCNTYMKNAKILRECVECGRLLCKTHSKKGLCPNCSQKLDYFVIESIKKKIKSDNLLYWLKLLLLSLPSIIILLIEYFEIFEISPYLLIIGMLGITLPFVIPVLLLLRISMKEVRHFKLASKVLNTYDDFPVSNFFVITKINSFASIEMEFNHQKRNKILIKFQKLVSWYGMDEMIRILAMHLKMRGVQTPNEIEKCMTPLIQDYKVNK